MLLLQDYSGKNKVFEVTWTWVPILLLPRCVTLGESLHFSKPQSPHLQNGNKHSVLFSG